MKKQETNYAIVTGVLVNKNRNADSNEVKRPVLDIEVVREINGNPIFEIIPVIICDIMLAKTIAGYKLGDILTIQGTVRDEKKGSIYIEADEITKYMNSYTGEELPVVYTASRIQLISMAPKFNTIFVIGNVVNITHQNGVCKLNLTVQREYLSRGNLNHFDRIPIILKKDDPKIVKGAQLFCMGEIGKVEDNVVLICSSARIVQ